MAKTPGIPQNTPHRRRRIRLSVLAVTSIAVLLAGAAVYDHMQLWQDIDVQAGWRLQHNMARDRCRILDDDNRLRAEHPTGRCRAAFTRLVSAATQPADGRHLVVLLHGMGRSRHSFSRMESALDAEGYDAVAVTYPSLVQDIESHAAQLNALLDAQHGVEEVSFVTHSLGGIVLRQALVHKAAWRGRIRIGRAVLIAPPNQGSELAGKLKDFGPYRVIAGPSGQQIAKGSGWQAPPLDMEFGIIAGRSADGDGYNPLLRGNDDGVVATAETHLHGAAATLHLTRIHTTIFNAPETIEATIRFLERGRFSE